MSDLWGEHHPFELSAKTPIHFPQKGEPGAAVLLAAPGSMVWVTEAAPPEGPEPERVPARDPEPERVPEPPPRAA